MNKFNLKRIQGRENELRACRACMHSKRQRLKFIRTNVCCIVRYVWFSTVHTCKTVGTSTMIIIHQINTCCTVFALTNTVINIFCACQAAPSFQTGTCKCARRIRTQFSIYARSQRRRYIRFAFINIYHSIRFVRREKKTHQNKINHFKSIEKQKWDQFSAFRYFVNGKM